jgi:hypothetical protein
VIDCDILSLNLLKKSSSFFLNPISSPILNSLQEKLKSIKKEASRYRLWMYHQTRPESILVPPLSCKTHSRLDKHFRIYNIVSHVGKVFHHALPCLLIEGVVICNCFIHVMYPSLGRLEAYVVVGLRVFYGMRSEMMTRTLDPVCRKPITIVC